MTANDPRHDELLALVNAAGFLFQARVEDEIFRTQAVHGKTILAREHRWFSTGDQEEGFIDLIISAGTNGKMVLECKRVRDADWVFLLPHAARDTHRVRVLWTRRFDQDTQGAAWDEFNLEPPSLEAQFCVVRGHGEAQQPMLERIASNLLMATEALADEELAYQRSVGHSGVRFYFPVLVTTATLQICRFQPGDVDLASGLLTQGVFNEVAFIRFTKSLSSGVTSSRVPSDLSEAARLSQRTIFVVNSSHLTQFLSGRWEFGAPPGGTPSPWDLPRWNPAE